MPLVLTTDEIKSGHGSPEGVVSAAAGVLYRNLDGGMGATFWAKTYGPGTTGWKAMNDPAMPVQIPSGSQLPSLASLMTGNPYVVQAERRLYVVQGMVNAAIQDQFGQYPTDTALATKNVLVGGRAYSGDAHANNNRLVSGHAFINLGASTPHEVAYVLDTAGTVGADIVTVYVGSDGTAGSTTGYAVAINRSGAYTISNGGSTVNSGNTGQTMIGADVECAVLMDATGKVTILRNGQVVASYTPTSAPTMGNYVGLSPSLVYSSGVISWVAAALGSLNWMRLEAVPQGGTTAQALRKASGADFDYSWQDDPPAIIPGLNTVRSGSGAPDNSVGQNGDWYLQESVPVVIYGPKSGGAWPTPGVSLKGDQGIQGLQGLQGVQGTLMRAGAGAPTSGVGNNGDWYIDTTNWRLYGPKASGAWPGTYTNLQGPQGIQGIQGLQGLQGIQGVPGKAGWSTLFMMIGG
jgi:hypothetical protein